LLQSYGTDNYTVYSCYDFASPTQNSSRLSQFGTYSSTPATPSVITITPQNTAVSYALTSDISPVQAGALLAFSAAAGEALSVTARFGVSFISADQACRNAEAEIPAWDFEGVRAASRTEWEDVLQRVSVDTAKEDPTVVELLYSSVGLFSFHAVYVFM
jgi:putative alpha-1,2-mannosidase